MQGKVCVCFGLMFCDKVMDFSSFGDEKNVLFSEKNENNVERTFFSAKRALVNGKERSFSEKSSTEKNVLCEEKKEGGDGETNP